MDLDIRIFIFPYDYFTHFHMSIFSQEFKISMRYIKNQLIQRGVH